MIGIISSLNIFRNAPLMPSGPHLFIVRKVLTLNYISVTDTVLRRSSLEFSLWLPPLGYFASQIFVIFASLKPELCSFEFSHRAVWVSVPCAIAWKLWAVNWGQCRSQSLLCFLSFKDHFPMLPVVRCLKTTVSYIYPVF